MNTDYQLRKDIDSVIELADYLNNLVEEAGVSSFKDLFANFYTKSEFDLSKAILNTDLDKLSKDLDGLNDDLNLLNEDLYDAEGHLKVTEEDLIQTKNSVTALSNSLTQLNTDLNNAEADLDDIESELNTTKSSLTQALSDLSNLSTELSSAKNRITTAEGKITTAENSISNHQTSISNLNTELNSAKDRITATENSLTTANNSISAHETSIGNLNTELDGAESRLTTTEQNIQSLRTSLTELDGSLSLLSDMLVNFQGTLTEFDEELVRKGIDKAELNSDIYKLVSQICVVKQDITDTDTKIDDTVTDINNLDTSVVPNLKNKIQEAKASGDTAQQDLAIAKTDINNLNSSTFPNLKNKIDEAKASGDTAQTALQQAKDDLEDLNTTVFPNLVGAIDDAQESGDIAQSNLTSAITKINSATADDGTFTQLHTSIANAKSAGDTAQANLDDSIDDIENLTGTIFPNLKNTINTVQTDIGGVQSDISDVQADIGTVTGGDLQTQINNVKSTLEEDPRIFIAAIKSSDFHPNQQSTYRLEDYFITHIDSIVPLKLFFGVRVGETVISDIDILPDRYWKAFIYYSGGVVEIDLEDDTTPWGGGFMYNFTPTTTGLHMVFLDGTLYYFDVMPNAHTHTLSQISDLTSSSETAFPYNSNATDYSTTNPVKITKWGRVITISGISKLSTSVSANGDVVIGTMTSYLPAHDIYTTWTGINKQGFIRIATDGTVTLSNRNGSSTSMSSGEYFVFNCTYLI